MGKFVIQKRIGEEFQFFFNAVNGKIILTSEGYYNMTACLNVIASVKMNGKEDSRYVRVELYNGKYLFNLAAINGQPIGMSELYESISELEEVIEYVKRTVVDAPVEDHTVSAIIF